MTPAIDATLTPTDHPLIGLDARGRPWVFGTNTKVTEIVRTFFGPPEPTIEAYLQDFPYLKPEQLRAALDYYAANKVAMDDLIRAIRAEEDRLRELHENTPASREWRARMLRLKAEWKRPS